MSIRNVVFALVACIVGAMLLFSGVVAAQAPAEGGGSVQGPNDPPSQVHGSLLQVMRIIVFVNSNVIFTTQSTDPETMERDDFESISPSAMTGLYGGWQAVENSGLALAEAANLLTIPGRRCANGRPVPMQNADWPELVQGLRDAGMDAFRAAQTKNQDAIVEVSETVTVACANCHEKYRDVEPLINRCLPD